MKACFSQIYAASATSFECGTAQDFSSYSGSNLADTDSQVSSLTTFYRDKTSFLLLDLDFSLNEANRINTFISSATGESEAAKQLHSSSNPSTKSGISWTLY